MAIKFPPRGFGPEGNPEDAPDRRWGDPLKLGKSWDHSDRKILLGEWDGRLLGDPDARHLPPGCGDDRHIVTIAGSRAGKSRDVLTPNLLRYPGSVVVIDPKGELARNTAQKRREFGDVFILDPFKIVGPELNSLQASFNPLWELSQSQLEMQPADAALIADALIIPGESQSHWTDSAKNLLRGLILHLLDTDAHTATLSELRRSLTLPAQEFIGLLEKMAASEAHEGVVANTGRGFLAKLERGDLSGELRSIVSTVNEQTWPLDDVARISQTSNFWLSSLSETPMTVYLVLPATRLATHFRWLRLVINLCIAALERNPVKDLHRGAPPVWMVLEEFAALGYMKSVETAAGFMAGMGCKLWVVLQDLTQIQTHYPKSWETFLGNAGVIQAWSNVDATTTEYLSKLIGQTTILEVNKERQSTSAQNSGDTGRREAFRTVPLLDPTEITLHFARETGRQLILSPSRPPIFMERFSNGAV